MANRSRPSPVTCLVVIETRGAGIILDFILGQKRLQMWILILATCRVRNSYTILDCVYSDTNGIFYILDMMCWDGYQVNIASICHIYDTYDLFVS